MSAGYAERLSEYPNKGVCGLPENYDSQRAFTCKVEKLSQLIQQSKYTVVLTGAGISTSAGVPDFRGPNGIWTREEEDRKRRAKRRRMEDKKQQRKKIGMNGSKEDSANTDGSALGDDINGTNVNGQSSSTDTSHNGRKRKQETAFDNNNNNNNGEEEDKSSAIDTKKKKFTSFENALPTYTHRALTHLILHPPPQPSATAAADDALPESSSDENNYDDNEEGLDNNNTITNNNGNTTTSNSDSDNDTTQQQQTRTYLHHIVTQNVDGLHRKTNLPRKHMSVLHGCIFTEICDTCQTEHISPTEVQSIGLQHTGHHCTLGGSPPGSCPGKLRDTMLDWEDELPIVDWNRAQEECARADLVVCLGTSLRIEPAAELCTYPVRYPGWTAAGEEAAEGEGREILDNDRKDYGSDNNNKKKKGRKKKKKKKNNKKSNTNHLIQKDNRLGYAVVNLQVTPYDDEAALVVRGKVDDVMEALMSKLGYNGDWEDHHNMLDGGREG